ncbi:MAG: hypothetical protein ACRDL7_00435 [Gaiellaceae bacterium]
MSDSEAESDDRNEVSEREAVDEEVVDGDAGDEEVAGLELLGFPYGNAMWQGSNSSPMWQQSDSSYQTYLVYFCIGLDVRNPQMARD